MSRVEGGFIAHALVDRGAVPPPRSDGFRRAGRKTDACAHAFERLTVGIPPNHFLNLRIRGSGATKTHTSLAQQ